MKAILLYLNDLELPKILISITDTSSLSNSKRIAHQARSAPDKGHYVLRMVTKAIGWN